MRLTLRPSPITTETVALAGKGFSNLQTTSSSSSSFAEDRLWFATRDPAQAGRTSVQCLLHNKDLRQATPLGGTHNVRSAVHEYGGGAYCVVDPRKGGGVIFTDFPSHALFRARPSSSSDNDDMVVVVEPLLERSHCRFADFSMSPTTEDPPNLIAIMEDHTHPEPAQVKNSIVAIALDRGSSSKEDEEVSVSVLASGHDFYATPKLNANGTKLAYVAWDHPNMPWDNANLYVQTCSRNNNNDKNGGGIITAVGPPTLIQDGHDDPNVSVAEPRWWWSGSNGADNDDDILCFLSDKNGWYNLYQWDENTNKTVNLYPKSADFSSAAQGWILGQSPYTFLPDGTLVACYTPKDLAGEEEKEEGARLVLIPRSTNENKAAASTFGRSCLPPTSISDLCAAASSSGGLYFVGGSTLEPPAIWYWARPGDDSCVAVPVLPSLDPMTHSIEPLKEYMSTPRLVQFPSKDSPMGMAHGYFYPPTKKNLSPSLPPDFKPPLLVKAHGGPTGRTSTTFRLDIQFWTSRGFAVLDVDYGGSTGYGKKYRQSLLGEWGIVDVADVCNGARWCVEQGLANGEWLCIDGRSAGGYTVLASLVFQDTFKAGASLYGVSDLGALARDTHKFESRYLDGLVGKYPQDKAIYDERCPINFTERLNCPVILLQGDEDKVVPPNQAEMMFEMLKGKGLQTALVMYKGEQHGFRKSENIRHALNSEYDFFCKIFGIEPQPEDGLSGVQMGERVEI